MSFCGQFIFFVFLVPEKNKRLTPIVTSIKEKEERIDHLVLECEKVEEWKMGASMGKATRVISVYLSHFSYSTSEGLRGCAHRIFYWGMAT